MSSLKRWLDRKSDREWRAVCFEDSVSAYCDVADDLDFTERPIWRFFERFESLGVKGCYQTKPIRVE